jgi:hypothetical protein
LTARIVTDPADYRLSGHRELIGLCRPHVVDTRSALLGFDVSSKSIPAEEYLHDVCHPSGSVGATE